MQSTLSKATPSLNAFEMTKRGIWQRRRPATKESFEQAAEYLWRAIELDPGYSDPFAELSIILSLDYRTGGDRQR